MIFTEADLARVDAYCAKAPPGPYKAGILKDVLWLQSRSEKLAIAWPGFDSSELNRRDRVALLRFIESAYTDLPALVEYVRELRRVVEVIYEWHEGPDYLPLFPMDEIRRLLGE